MLTNRLRYITDATAAGNYTTDIDGQPNNNYIYDNIGNLIGDTKENITNITWTVYGKIKKINKSDGSSLEYKYDPAGNRVYKEYQKGGQLDKTWYVRDAQGNVLAVYGNKNHDAQIYWKEQALYGSSRLGQWQPDMNMASPNSAVLWAQAGLKRYEFGNHLGNVLAVATDKKLAVDGDGNGQVDYYTPEVANAQDYYPFGMLQPGRSFALGGGYRYGFNGKENDNEVKGEGNQQDYGMRIYDPRVGRFLSVDPLTQEYPWYTPYQFAGNTPIQAVDRDGAEEELTQFASANKQKALLQLKYDQQPRSHFAPKEPNWAEDLHNWPTSDGIWFKGAKDLVRVGYGIANDAAITFSTITYGKNHAFGLDNAGVADYKERVGANLNTLTNLVLPVIEAQVAKVTTPELEALDREVVESLDKYPGAASVVGSRLPNGAYVITPTGKMPTIMSPTLEAELQSKAGPIGSRTPAGNVVGCCSEQRGGNELLLEHPQYGPRDVQHTRAYRPRNGAVIPMCGNCGAVFQQPMPRTTGNLWYIDLFSNIVSSQEQKSK